MSSGTKSREPKKKAQAKSALSSGHQPQQGAAAGGGGAGDLREIIEIDLVEISPMVWGDAAYGNSVRVVKERNGGFEVLLAGIRLGCIPPDYDDLLAPKASYRGKIIRHSENPIGVRIEVSL